mmetsp:Transcript_7856/g.7921  ORF Transcript_7856/g.7921 Transcript_7856/m.7921 type:complete len:246 (-) Transcript_7856:146-883(-)
MIESILMRLLLICIMLSYSNGLLVNSKIRRQHSINPIVKSLGKSMNPIVKRTSFHSSSSRLNAALVIDSVMAVSLFADGTILNIAKQFISSSIATITMIFSSVSGASVIGGLLSGGLHAISGPDHLAALLPASVGKPGWYGLRLGSTWGLGHGVSAIFLGMCAFFLKDRMSSQYKALQQLGLFAEGAVGVSLFIIGAIGVKENLELSKEQKDAKDVYNPYIIPSSSLVGETLSPINFLHKNLKIV